MKILWHSVFLLIYLAESLHCVRDPNLKKINNEYRAARERNRLQQQQQKLQQRKLSENDDHTHSEFVKGKSKFDIANDNVLSIGYWICSTSRTRNANIDQRVNNGISNFDFLICAIACHANDVDTVYIRYSTIGIPRN